MDKIDARELERILAEDGWQITSNDQTKSRRRRHGAFLITLTAPTGVQFDCVGRTRTEALRAAAVAAGLIEPDGAELA